MQDTDNKIDEVETLKVDDEGDNLEKMEKRKKTRRIIHLIGLGTLFTLAFGIMAGSIWYKINHDVPFANLLFTMTSPTTGAPTTTFWNVFAAVFPALLLAAGVYVACVFIIKKFEIKVLYRRLAAWVCLLAFVGSLVGLIFAFRIPEYLKDTSGESVVYENFYIDPAQVSITSEEKPKNLIYIYLESMECTYMQVPQEDGTTHNYIPLLTQLAEDNINFSNNDGVGGFDMLTNAGWTMGALMATTAGATISLPDMKMTLRNETVQDGNFVNNLTGLGDILEQKGYNQEFLCGSEAAFGARDIYFTQHGNYNIFDLIDAREKGYIAEDYSVNWGYEDEILYKIAKDEITAMASKDEPFNFTMLTVDTHFPGGYVCNLCKNDMTENDIKNLTYDEACAISLDCADKQVLDFINWCKTQDFYEDTVIVVSGDHCRMDKCLVDGKEYSERQIYNCFINTSTIPVNAKNRQFTALDIMPTVLASLGYEIEGNKLGLGTNLFSNEQTLVEKMGFDWVDSQTQKKSEYYRKNFM